jgi:hypothetical protein
VDQGEDEKGGAGRRAAAEVFPRESKKALLESAKEKGLVKDSRFVRESEVRHVPGDFLELYEARRIF